MERLGDIRSLDSLRGGGPSRQESSGQAQGLQPLGFFCGSIHEERCNIFWESAQQLAHHGMLAPCYRDGSLEPHRLLSDRMFDLKPPGVQCDAQGKLAGAAVLAVADDRMPQLGQLDANLMLATGFQLHFQKR